MSGVHVSVPWGGGGGRPPQRNNGAHTWYLYVCECVCGVSVSVYICMF